MRPARGGGVIPMCAANLPNRLADTQSRHGSQLAIQSGQEGTVNRRTYGWIIGFVGASLGAWWWRQMFSGQQLASAGGAFGERGTVIFDNAPRPSETDLTL